MWASNPRPATAIAKVFCQSVPQRLDALVAEDALRVVAHVELVVDLHRLGDRRGVAVAGVVVAGDGVVALAGRGRRRGRSVALRLASYSRDPARRRSASSRDRPTSRAARAPSCGRGATRSESVCTTMPVLDLARARRHEHARALDLDHAHAAGVHRRERLAVAERRDVDAGVAARLQDRRRPRGRGRPSPSIVELDRASRRDARTALMAVTAHGERPQRRAIADSIGVVRPSGRARRSRRRASPAPISSSSATSSSTLPRGAAAASRSSASSWRTVPTRHGTHWPHDSSRKNAAMRSRIGAGRRCRRAP